MQFTLFVPGLLLPGKVLTDTVFDLNAPSLSLLLGRARCSSLDPDWLANSFGLASPLPAASLRKVGAGSTAPGEWLCLDPVHFEVRREGILLADPAQLDITAAEAAALIDAIQPLFADWGEISASAPSTWELHLNRSSSLDLQALPDAVGQPVSPAYPGGTDGKEWRRLLAEAQTVLHAHPVNRQRENHGRPTLNSLWPWGQGALPAKITADYSIVWSNDPIMAGLCAHAGIPCLAPPDRFTHASGHVLACVDNLEWPARTYDAINWRAQLLSLEERWLAPALTALKKREFKRLNLVATGSDAVACQSCSLTRGDLRRFWRRPQPLTALAEST